MDTPETEISLRIENKTAYADVYEGINATENPTGASLDDLYNATSTGRAALFIGNTDSDSSLDYNEKGYLVISLNTGEEALEREHIWLEIRPEKGAPLSVEFIVPPQLTQGWHTIGS
jgi:archaellin